MKKLLGQLKYHKIIFLSSIVGQLLIAVGQLLLASIVGQLLAIVNRCEGLSKGIWLYALFMSAIEKIGPLKSVSIIWSGSIGQLHFVPSIIVFI